MRMWGDSRREVRTPSLVVGHWPNASGSNFGYRINKAAECATEHCRCSLSRPTTKDQSRFAGCYCLSPIHFSDTTIELPGFWGSYRTDVGSPNLHECRLIHCLRWVTSCEAS